VGSLGPGSPGRPLNPALYPSLEARRASVRLLTRLLTTGMYYRLLWTFGSAKVDGFLVCDLISAQKHKIGGTWAHIGHTHPKI